MMPEDLRQEEEYGTALLREYAAFWASRERSG
jgi:hypothetical protein